jgi:peptide/nickel transport system permease protein
VIGAPAAQTRRLGRVRSFATLRALSPSARAGGLVVIAVLAIALISVFWTPYDRREIALDQRLAPPFTDGHLLGTDGLGRDELTMLMIGAFNSMYVALLGAGAAFVAGVTIMVIAVARRGRTEGLLMRGADIIYATPVILVALVLVARLGPSRETAIIAVMLWFAPVVARVGRSAALAVANSGYVQAARAYGRGMPFAMVRHVLPNISSVLLVQFTVAMVTAIMLEAALSYLGVGTQPPEVSWGRMLHDSQQYLGQSVWLAVWPGVAILVTVIALNLFHDGLRDVFDKRSASSSR